MKCRVNYFLIALCDVCHAIELCKNGFVSAIKEHCNSTKILFFTSVTQQTESTAFFSGLHNLPGEEWVDLGVVALTVQARVPVDEVKTYSPRQCA
jgi:hypothetical protein